MLKLAMSILDCEYCIIKCLQDCKADVCGAEHFPSFSISADNFKDLYWGKYVK